MTQPDSGQLEYPREGFVIRWDPRGLTIEVVDYHSEVLHLSWEMLQDLARRARPGPSPDAAASDEGTA